ncbi:hypothetical protein CC1G_15492 [Coprinopsis cinerea okayama7|uniref:Uncharacterized protein n=1 Tax=Coprinopsis cinerea (strain Okayama-7 / 130 / ATCC MYA-4618 / FGSC 9003) TaxID=240176 RepID=A8PGV8_COPC7|nr:hypothetical protein CC1G_15492 [Coprinopsis cinerea okayama7\|eukprot:XP_001841290.1 hypothetical protein CC1G_15492 [Coprinopsis cinerea okayama7\
MTTKTSQTPDPVLYLDPHEVERSATLASDRVGHIPADEDKIEVSPQSDAGSPSPSTDLPRPAPRSKSTAGKAPTRLPRPGPRSKTSLKPSKKQATIHRSLFPMIEQRRRDRQLAARAAGHAAIARLKYRSVVSRLQQLSNTLSTIDDILNADDRDNSDKVNDAIKVVEQEIGGECLWDSADSDCASLGGIPSDSD